MAWKPGESGNPGGRSTDRPWREALRSVLQVIDPIEKKNKLGLLAERVVQLAMDGDVQAIKEIANRIDGMPQQQLEVSQVDDLSLEDKRAFAGLLAAFIAERRAVSGADDTRH